MIDLKAARNDPDAYRAALERKGAGEAFDAVLAADERWRALVPAIDELRGRGGAGRPAGAGAEPTARVGAGRRRGGGRGRDLALG